MLKFSDEAIADLRAIREYIAEEDPKQAALVAEDIIRVCGLLESYPDISRLGVEPGTREMNAATSWVVVYEKTEAGLFILRVWHSRQSRR